MTSKSPVARSPSAGRPPSRTTPPAKLPTQVYSLWSSAGFMLQKTPPVPPPPGYSPLPSAALKPPQPTKARTTIDPPRDRDPMLRQPLQQVDPNHSGVGATAGWAASKTEMAAAVASVNQPQESGQTRRSEGTEGMKDVGTCGKDAAQLTPLSAFVSCCPTPPRCSRSPHPSTRRELLRRAA